MTRRERENRKCRPVRLHSHDESRRHRTLSPCASEIEFFNDTATTEIYTRNKNRHLALLHSSARNPAKSATCPQVRSPLVPQFSELDERDPWRPVHGLPERDGHKFCVVTPIGWRQADLPGDVRGRTPDTEAQTSARPGFSTCYWKGCVVGFLSRPWPLAQDEGHGPDHRRDERCRRGRGPDLQGFAERLHHRAQSGGRAREMTGPTALQTGGRN